MKKVIRVIMLSLALLLITGTKGDAKEFASPNVKLEGSANGIVYIPEGEPFLEMKNMVPGDKLKGKLVLINKFTDTYEIFIRAERVNHKEEYDLLEKLKMQINYNDNLLYSGNAAGERNIKENTSLGKIKPGEIKELIAEVNLDGPSTGNEYKDKIGEVNWIFTAIKMQKEDNVISHELPNTGDNRMLECLVVIIICLIMLMLINRKEKKI